MHKRGQAVDYLLRILLHIVLDPVEHYSDERVLIKIRDELLVVLPDVQILGAFVHYANQEIVGQLVEVQLHLLAAH